MKSILLASASIVAFAGAAAAEITFSGSAELGYNDTDIDDAIVDDDHVGFYGDLDLTIGFSQELDNGLTASASIDLEDLAGGQDSGEENGGVLGGVDGETVIEYELSLTSETAGLYYGDTSFAAENLWDSAGDMEGDGFSEADGEEVLRGEVVYGDIEAQLSYVLGTADGARNIEEDLNQLSLGVSADFGNYNVVLAYQDESDEAAGFYDAANGDFVDSQVWGISVGTSFAGADVRVAYAEEDGADESLGFEVSYPFGPVTATAYYVVEDDEAGNDDPNYGLTLAYSEGPVAVTFDYDNDQGTNKYGLEGSYDVGNGLVVYGGYLFIEDLADESAFYVGGEYDLGSGAALLVSYAEGDDDEYEDEIGAQDYQDGTTVEISFDF